MTWQLRRRPYERTSPMVTADQPLTSHTYSRTAVPSRTAAMARATREASGRAMKASLLVVRWCVIAAPSLAAGTCSAELKRPRRLGTAAPANDAEPLEAAAVSKPVDGSRKRARSYNSGQVVLETWTAQPILRVRPADAACRQPRRASVGVSRS